MRGLLRKFLLTFYSFTLLSACYNLNQNQPIPEPSAYSFYQQALEKRIEGDLSGALQMINKALRLNNHISMFYVLKGQIFDSLQVLDSAFYYYQKSLTYRSHSPEVLIRLAELSLQMGNSRQAIRFYRKAYVESPDSTDWLLKISQIYLNENQLEKAQNILDEYRITQKRREEVLSPFYYINLADLSLMKGDSASAARNYAQSGCGNCLSEKQAEWAFETLLKQNNLSAYFNLLSGLQKNRNFPDGLLFYYRGLYYKAIGNQNEALRLFERAYQNGLRNAKLLKALLHYYTISNRIDSMKEIQKELQKLKLSIQYEKKEKNKLK